MNELSIQIKNLTKKFAPGYYQSIDVDEGWYQIVLDCDKELSANKSLVDCAITANHHNQITLNCLPKSIQ